MNFNFRQMLDRQMYRVMAVLAATLVVGACSQEIPPHMRPLSKEAMHLLGNKGMSTSDPIFVRIFKQESELEVWKQRADGRFYHFKTYPICNWSGALGPKLQEGDSQSPEGFYTVTEQQMNPNSEFHLSFNLGFPNQYDRAHKRTGSALMVHGDCRSAGCYAMTDALVEEIYAIAREAFRGGQKFFRVHSYPFRMTAENMRRYRRSKWYGFWRQLKEGHDYFEMTRTLPNIYVCARRYLVSAKFVSPPRRLNPTAACPAYRKIKAELWTGTSSIDVTEQVVAPGRKLRNFASQQRTGTASGAYGLTKVPSKRNFSIDRRSSWRAVREQAFDKAQ